MKILDFRLVSIGEAALFDGVSVPTMKRWDKGGKLKPTTRTFGNHRRYQLTNENKLKVGYARVSSYDQRNDLITQAKFLAPYCDMVLKDLGSGLNCKKPQLKKLISMLLNKQIKELHLSHKDRLLRFGHELVFQLCKWSGAAVIIHNEEQVISFEEELCKDVITLMIVFSARLYGKRSHTNKKQTSAA